MKAEQPKSFSDGIRMLNERGALVVPGIRLTKKRALILWDGLQNIQDTFYRNNSESETLKQDEDEMQYACHWLMNIINRRWSQNELHNESK